MRNKKVLFIRQGARSFFDTDLMILKEFSDVCDFDNYPPCLSKIFLLINKIIWCDLIYIWFMGRHAVMPLIFGKLLRKKIILVAGGWDVANCPEINYGLMRPGGRSFFVKPLFKLPDLILSVSKSNHSELLKNTEVSLDKTKMIYLGFEDLKCRSEIKKEKMVVTIGEINQSNLKRKGLEMFVRTAAELPEVPFVLIGRWSSDGAIDYLKSIAGPNVQFTNYLSREEIDSYLDRAAVYAQLSYHEAFGCAVIEALQHGCIPVVANQYALPEIVGSEGVIVSLDFKDIVKGLRQALEIRLEINTQNHSSKFSYEARKDTLKQSLAEIF